MPTPTITKDDIVRSVSQLPPDATVADALDRLVVLREIEIGLDDVRAGRTVPHAQVVAEMRRRFAKRRADVHDAD
jgi:predicted transcriptional regulator